MERLHVSIHMYACMFACVCLLVYPEECGERFCIRSLAKFICQVGNPCHHPFRSVVEDHGVSVIVLPCCFVLVAFFARIGWGARPPPRCPKVYGTQRRCHCGVGPFEERCAEIKFCEVGWILLQDTILATELIIQALSGRPHLAARRTVLTHGPEAAITAFATDKRGGRGRIFILGGRSTVSQSHAPTNTDRRAGKQPGRQVVAVVKDAQTYRPVLSPSFTLQEPPRLQ